MFNFLKNNSIKNKKRLSNLSYNIVDKKYFYQQLQE